MEGEKSGTTVVELGKKLTARERAFVRQLEGGCTSPVAAFAQVEGAMLTLTGLYVSPDETVVRRGILRGEKTNAEKLGADLARRLKGE